jgi:hypothetical protein
MLGLHKGRREGYGESNHMREGPPTQSNTSYNVPPLEKTSIPLGG